MVLLIKNLSYVFPYLYDSKQRGSAEGLQEQNIHNKPLLSHKIRIEELQDMPHHYFTLTFLDGVVNRRSMEQASTIHIIEILKFE